jgi:hypothetical protein
MELLVKVIVNNYCVLGPNISLIEHLLSVKFYFCVSVHRSIGQIKHQRDATLCRFYFCKLTLHVSGVKRPSSGVLKTGTAATGTCVMVEGRSSHHHIRLM